MSYRPHIGKGVSSCIPNDSVGRVWSDKLIIRQRRIYEYFSYHTRAERDKLTDMNEDINSNEMDKWIHFGLHSTSLSASTRTERQVVEV